MEYYCLPALYTTLVLDSLATSGCELLQPHSPAGELSGVDLGQPSWAAVVRNTPLLRIDKNPPVDGSW